ncbi:glycosyltransferase family 2 protein [Salinibacter sp.]|uniref:glycosyltransferase family 2 protein n=1 Tax=Salinibacter sp. TaxID=2065818 RepID=UPI0021E70276|nr:glycosyltransferase [Salinibacter sp.]
MADPLISVILPVYNGRPYLQEAIQSILNQMFEDFEFIIINDGSKDGSKEVLEEFAEHDHRIRVVHQKNQGITPSLNRGLKLARGRCIARMDADDISHPERFARQIDFLESNPDVGILGTQIRQVDADGNPSSQWVLPTDPDLIGWQLLFSTCLCHPTVMIRHSLLDNLGGYAEWATHAEDYELWTRAVLKSRLANLPDTLHMLRRHDDSITATKREEQLRVCRRATARLHEAVLAEKGEREIAHFLARMHHENVQKAMERSGIQDVTAVHEYVRTLYRQCVKNVLPGVRNVEVRRAALPKLDAIADQIARRHGHIAGFLHKLRARFMAPVAEVIPWAASAARERVAQNEEIY